MIGIILGDSAVISRYPNLDADARWTSSSNQQYGADFLLWQNDDARFPEFAGRDLRTVTPAAKVYRRAQDGGTRDDVPRQISAWMDEPIGGNPELVDIVCVSIGGNDLLGALHLAEAIPARHKALRGVLLQAEADYIGTEIIATLNHVRRTFPTATMLVNTVYDPTDETGELEGIGPVPIELLYGLNNTIRGHVELLERAAYTPAIGERCSTWSGKTILCDVAEHFLGHGITAKKRDRWYWEHSIIEPNVFGASEIRRLWIDALGL